MLRGHWDTGPLTPSPTAPPHTHTLSPLQGPEAKVVLDAVIDACSQMQNLREAIASYRSRFLKEMRERQRNTLLNVCLVRRGGWGVLKEMRERQRDTLLYVCLVRKGGGGYSRGCVRGRETRCSTCA